MGQWLAWMLCCMTAALFAQAPAPPVPQKNTPENTPAKRIQVEASSGLELWETRLGRIWIPSPGEWVVSNLEWEQVDRKIYDHASCRVRKGDVVLDCGAHVGFFTRAALSAGARLVVAIEPEAKVLAAFRRNFEEELKSGRVKLVAKGVWDKPGKLELRLVDNSNDASSVVFDDNRKQSETIELTTIDALARELKLPRIDFIKMDIEGAERNALRGARASIARWRPRMALSAYHLKGDPAEIAKLAWEMRPDYRIASGDLVESPHADVVPKVLFFY